jgi:hypothetical protein
LGEGVEPRAEYLRSAVWWFRSRGDLASALQCAEAAIADGGATWIDPRGDLIGVLLAMGDARADESIRELRRELAHHPDPDTLIEMVAEDLVEHGKEREALRWYSIGISDLDPTLIENDSFDLAGLLVSRARLRRVIGLGWDKYDQAAERLQWAMDERRRAESGDLGTDPDATSKMVTLLWWPDTEFDALVRRWPEMAQGYGGTAADHRVQTELHLRAHARAGIQIRVGRGVLADLLAYAESHQLDPLTGQARALYAAELGRTEQASPFPPGRRSPCWCGSGAVYRDCCGAQ